MAYGQARRGAIGGAVLALHLLLLWALLLAMRSPQVLRAAAEPVMTWLSLPDWPAAPAVQATAPRAARSPSAASAGSHLPRALDRMPGVPAVPALVSPADALPSPITPAPSRAAIDWQAAAENGARQALAAEQAQARRERSMGPRPGGVPGHVPKKEAFPWGHQPKGKHYDVQGPVVVLRSKRCVVALLLFVPAGFSCNPGRVDEEPGQGDLFDPKYRAQPLELPKPLIDDPLAQPAPAAPDAR